MYFLDSWILWNHWVLLSLQRMFASNDHHRYSQKISSKDFHKDFRTAPTSSTWSWWWSNSSSFKTWLNWFHIHNNPNYFSAMIFRLTSNWFSRMWNCIYWFVMLVEMMIIIWTWIAAFHDIKYHFKVHFGKEKERDQIQRYKVKFDNLKYHNL